MDYHATQYPIPNLHPLAMIEQAVDFIRRQNALLPVSRLPPELVVYVMQLAATFETPDWIEVKPWSWIALTQVYSYWRVVALENPALWSNIVLRPYGEAQLWMCLKRAKKVPLVIRDSKYAYNRNRVIVRPTEPMLLILGAYWDQVRELDLSLSFEDVRLIRWPTYLSSNLDTLKLRNQGSNNRLHLASLIDCIVHSNIRRLTLTEFYDLADIWRVEGLPRTLTHLHLDGYVLSRSQNIELCSLQQVIDVLQGLSLLESLDLSGVLKYPPNSTSTSVLRPQKLRDLTICAPAPQVMDFFRSIQLPSTTFIRKRIYCFLNQVSINWTDITRIIPSVFRQSPPLDDSVLLPATLSCMVLFHYPHNNGMNKAELMMSCFVEQLDPCDPLGNEATADLEISFFTQHEDAVWHAEPTLDACRGLPVQSTVSLMVRGFPSNRDARSAWFEYLRRDFRKVQVLSLWGFHGIHSADVLAAYLLTGAGAVHSSNISENIIFPELRELHIHGLQARSATLGRSIVGLGKPLRSVGRWAWV